MTTAPQKIKVVLVDDQPLWLGGLIQAVSLEDDIEVLCTIEEAAQAVATLQELQPDVVVLDISMPGLNGLQVLAKLKASEVHASVVILTNYDELDQIIHAINAGAAAFCSKDIESERLVEVIRVVAQGYYVIHDKVYDYEGAQERIKKIARMLAGYREDETTQAISAREMEILIYVTRGYSNKEIARTLSISNQTVKNHMTSILRKLDVQDRTQAAMYALRHGWIKLGDTLRRDGNRTTFEDEDDEVE